MYKCKIKSELENYMMAIPEWLFMKCYKQNQVRLEQIGRFDQIFFVEGDYKAEIGFQVLKGEEENRFF